ncbi:MAG: PP2C family protein-serine/threonine phosphatase [Candidatus Dadabacteria bacterium]
MADNFFGLTDTGRLRDNNEDAFIAEKVQDGNYILGCVIDGVGGYEGGEVAAEIARQTILDVLQKSTGDLISQMRLALRSSNEKIYKERSTNNDRQNMACVLTMAIVDIQNNQFYYAHVGDTRLYLFRDHSLVKVTKDHSFVGFLEDSKRLSEDAAMNHPKRNEINKALGFDPNMGQTDDYIEVGQSPFLPGDILLLCSDGLTDLVNSASISSILSSSSDLEQKATELINSANNAGGKDNITVVLVHNDKKPLTHKATKPVLIKKKHVQKEQPPAEQAAEEIKHRPSRKKGRDTALWILGFVLVLSLIVMLVIWGPRHKRQPDVPAVVQKPRNQNEIRLADSIKANQGWMINLSDSLYGNQLVITDTLLIEKDSIHINGNGLVLRRDSSYTGPAFLVSPTTKYALLENILLDGFDIGVFGPAKAIRLKNVKFHNCRIPVMAEFIVNPDLYASGYIKDSVFKTDTLSK